MDSPARGYLPSGTIMEASRVREEEERKAKERRRATIYERKELNIDRSVADENAVQRASDSTASVQGPTCTSTQYYTRDAARTQLASTDVYKYSVLHQRRCKDPSCKDPRVLVRSTASVQGPKCTSTQYYICARTHVYK